jgi:hypothetical protein
MLNVLSASFAMLSSVFQKHVSLQIEILALRHQIGVLQRSTRKRHVLVSHGSNVVFECRLSMNFPMSASRPPSGLTPIIVASPAVGQVQ